MPSFDLATLGRGDASTFLWGESRSVVNRLLYAMVHAVDPEPLWLDLAPRLLAESEEAGPIEMGWIPSDRLFEAAEPDVARPQDAVGNMALLNVVRSDEPPEEVARLADFVRLAPIAQEVISRVRLNADRHALAVANSDRVRGDYPHTVDGIRPIVTALLDAPLTPFIGAQGTPGGGRMAFTYVFEVRAMDLAHWREGTLIPEKVPRESSLVVGVPIPLPSIVPGLTELFSAVPGPK